MTWKADIDLPEGTIELRDETGRVLCRIENIGKAPWPMPEPTLECVRLKIQAALGNGVFECDWMPGESWLDAAVRGLDERRTLRAEIAAMNDADANRSIVEERKRLREGLELFRDAIGMTDETRRELAATFLNPKA